jgi:hypothetical protein
MTFQVALINYGLFKAGKADSAKTVLREWAVDSVAAIQLWKFLSSTKEERHKNVAIWTAQHIKTLQINSG